jgi:beta-galactosidase GanA
MVSVFGCSQNKNNPVDNRTQSNTLQIPRLEKQGTATRLVVEGKPFLLISGELHNSTSGGIKYMKPVWKKLAKKNLNSVIATVSWELIETGESKFDFSLVDSIIAGARESDLKLVLIWFASWKNASSVYIPSWVKKDYLKYPRVKDENGKPLEILSTFGSVSVKADARAFAALMRHIKEVDSVQQTVVMMQVENEMGVNDHLGETPGNARRDFNDQANEAYRGSVPQKMIDYLVKHRGSLFPELYKVWSSNGFKTSGSWEEVFGKSQLKPDQKDWQYYSYYTEELFMAWNYAGYVEKVAEAGKGEYPLPMYVNAWLKQPTTSWPGRYPSGGPLPQVLDVWRAAAPSIDFIAPDIYIDEFTWVCNEFTRSGNPLFIPETRGGEVGAATAFYAFGEYSAGCFAPFGIDNVMYETKDPLDESYALLRKMSSVILENQGKGTMRGILLDERSPILRFELGNYIIEAKRGGDGSSIAGGLIIQTGPQEYICAGKALDIFFLPKDNSMRIAIDAADEGTFEDGKWIAERRLNGDEVHASTWDGTGLKFPDDKPAIQRISLYQYR